MKLKVAGVLALCIVGVMAGEAKADVGANTFEEFPDSCIYFGGMFESWNNAEIGTCLYAGNGGRDLQKWFWASQLNVKDSLKTYKSDGPFKNQEEARKDMMKELKLDNERLYERIRRAREPRAKN